MKPKKGEKRTSVGNTFSSGEVRAFVKLMRALSAKPEWVHLTANPEMRSLHGKFLRMNEKVKDNE